jgi:hypothetical protein
MSDETPRVDSDNRSYPRPEYAEEIVFEGSRHVVISPEAYEELYEIARTLERELNAANDRIKRLEEAGDAVEERLGCGCGCGGPCRACRSASENWFKVKEAKL